jgi:hypothetical protein
MTPASCARQETPRVVDGWGAETKGAVQIDHHVPERFVADFRWDPPDLPVPARVLRSSSAVR